MGWSFLFVGGECCRSIGSAVAIIVNLYRVERDHMIDLQWKRTRGMVKSGVLCPLFNFFCISMRMKN